MITVNTDVKNLAKDTISVFTSFFPNNIILQNILTILAMRKSFFSKAHVRATSEFIDYYSKVPLTIRIETQLIKIQRYREPTAGKCRCVRRTISFGALF